MDDDSAKEVGQDRATILVHGQQKVSSGREIKTIDVGAMRKGKGIRGIAVRGSQLVHA